VSKGGCINRGRRNNRKKPRENPLNLGVVARQERATERQTLRNIRSSSAQRTLLDARLGKDVGAVKERARLARIAAKAA
jgi:hypothetical protein